MNALTDRLCDILRADAMRLSLMRHVEALALPDAWIGAGFVRNAVWDHLHGRAPAPPETDIDVIFFDAANASKARDEALTARLAGQQSDFVWSVHNQARMHIRNDDAPYSSSAEAVRHWPDTATAIAVRLRNETFEVLAPYGLEDLFALVLRPTPDFVSRKRDQFEARLKAKQWLTRWPLLRITA